MKDEQILKRKLDMESTALTGLKDWVKDFSPTVNNVYFEDDVDGGFKGVLDTEDGDLFFRYYKVESSGSYTWWCLKSLPATVIPGGSEIATTWKATLDAGDDE
jgi:hypothetical protein